MIHTTNDFYNKAATSIKIGYFSGETTLPYEHYIKAKYQLELFNNGCLTYRKLIGRLSKICNDTTNNVNNLIEKHVISFGSYKYKPSKQLTYEN